MTTLRVSVMALLLAGCAGSPPPAGEPTATAEADPSSLPTIDVEISRSANLYHWIDVLAGSSPAKTRDAYFRYWIGRHGPLDAGDRRALAGFRRARLFGRPDRPTATDGACLPERGRPLPARQRLTVAAIDARDESDFLTAAARIVPGPEHAGLAEALERFGPRFNAMWGEFDQLEPFAADLRRWLETPDVRDLLARVAEFLGAEIDAGVPVTISLMALPERGPTHAEADGHHLLIEVRPGDLAADQAQVVFHELIHDLMRRIPADRLSELARSFMEHGAIGNLSWALLHEGLPTTLGQGVAEERLGRRGFSVAERWYHIESIDLFARLIFPTIRGELYSTRAIYDGTARRIVAVVANSELAEAPLFGFLEGAAVVSSGELLERLGERDMPIPSLHGWPARWDDPDGLAFVSAFDCMPIIVVTTEAEHESLARALGPLLPRDDLRIPAGASGVIVPGRRSSGAPVLLVSARRVDDLPWLIESARRNGGWPGEPIVLSR